MKVLSKFSSQSGRFQHLSLRIVGLLLGVGIVGSVEANPSMKDPGKPLATHNTVPEAGPLADALYASWKEAWAFSMECEATLAKRGAIALPPKPLGQWKAKTEQALRDAKRLRLMGEPAGVDLQLRWIGVMHHMNTRIQDYSYTPPGGVLRAKILAQLQKQQPAREREYAKISAMALGKKFAEAEKAINGISMQIDEVVYFLPIEERGPFQGPLNDTRNPIDAAMAQIRIAQAAKFFQDAIALNTPNPVALTQWATTAADQLRTAGKATVEGKGELTGPDLLNALSERWGTGHANLQRVQGYRWALRWHGAENPNSGTYVENRSDPIYTETTAWTDAVLNSMVTIIKADSESIPPDAVPLRHQAYLKVIAAMATMSDSGNVQKKADEALAPLLAKNSVYDSSVKNYEAATNDLFTFQNRIAKEFENSMSKEYLIANDVVRENSRCIGVRPGLYPESGNVEIMPMLTQKADATMIEIAPKWVGKKVRFDGVRRISPTSKTSAAQFNIRTYGTALAAAIPELQLKQIKQDLLVDESHPALSVRATKALTSAELGNYNAVGGTVVSGQIESMITRFISMSDATAIMVPRGGVIDVAIEQQTMMSQMAARVDIDPSWVEHDLGIYRVPGK